MQGLKLIFLGWVLLGSSAFAYDPKDPEYLLTLPFEIRWTSIYPQLSQRELLNLARTSNTFRDEIFVFFEERELKQIKRVFQSFDQIRRPDFQLTGPKSVNVKSDGSFRRRLEPFKFETLEG